MIAVGWADVVAAGFVAVVTGAGFFVGVVFAAGEACDHPTEHAAAISKQIERQCRIEAPGGRTSPGRADEDICPYVGCDDSEVRFYPRVGKNGWSRLETDSTQRKKHWPLDCARDDKISWG